LRCATNAEGRRLLRARCRARRFRWSVRATPARLHAVWGDAVPRKNPGPPRRGPPDTNLRTTKGASPTASRYRFGGIRQSEKVDGVNSGNVGERRFAEVAVGEGPPLRGPPETTPRSRRRFANRRAAPPSARLRRVGYQLVDPWNTWNPMRSPRYSDRCSSPVTSGGDYVRWSSERRRAPFCRLASFRRSARERLVSHRCAQRRYRSAISFHAALFSLVRRKVAI
jgi:hypothetical protein